MQGGKRAKLRSEGRAGGFMLRYFWSIRGFQEALKRSGVSMLNLRRFRQAVGAQVGPKLGPSWLPNGPKFEKY